MPSSRETGRSRPWWKAILLPIAILITLPLIAQKAQKTSGPKYDLGTETKVKDTLEEVRLPQIPYVAFHIAIIDHTLDFSKCPIQS